MSIKIMSAVFETEFPTDFKFTKKDKIETVRASTAKLVLLAIADHCNDDGIAYPGLTRLELKTSLSRQGIIDTIEALKYNGILDVQERNIKHNTNTYSLNLEAFPNINKELPKQILGRVVNTVDQGSQQGLPVVVNTVDLNHHLTINKPPLSDDLKTSNPSLLDEGFGRPNLSGARPAPKPEREPKKNYTLQKKDYDMAKDITVAVLSNSDKSKTMAFTSMPELFIPYAKAFCDATGIRYSKKYYSDWCDTFERWINLGFQPSDVTSVVEWLIENGKSATISRPGSIEWRLQSSLVERKKKDDYFDRATEKSKSFAGYDDDN